MEQERVTIRDIAEELGLSTATVSNVIHGKTKKISDETVQRVQAVLEKRHYIPSMAGILLAQNDSRIIGIFINDHEKYEGHTLDDAFIASSLNALSTEIEAQGQFMMVKKAKNPEEVIRFASMWNMDGLIVIGFCEQDYSYLRSHMRIPFVVYDGVCTHPERIVNVMIDNRDGGRQMGELFRRLGHERALCISDNETGVDQERLEGFRSSFGVQETETLIIPMKKEERWKYYREKLPLFQKRTAIFAVSDHYAADLMCFLQEQGFRIPQDLSVAGFDDIGLCELISPTLTTIRQDGVLRAKTAVEKLKEMKAGNVLETEIVLPVTLVERNSTGRKR